MGLIGEKILIWLPCPLGDAVLSTAALKAIVSANSANRIVFAATKAIADLLTPNEFANEWLILGNSLSENVKAIKSFDFDSAILFKNSFESALTVWLAGIKTRIGYSRQGRGLFLSDRLIPPKKTFRKYMPLSMIDYYLAIAGWCGADVSDRKMTLSVDAEDTKSVCFQIPLLNEDRLKVILVPGGAFGPSKCWNWQNYAKTAKELIGRYHAAVFICAAPSQIEMQIAEKICSYCDGSVINLAKYNLSLPKIKAVFDKCDLVISNDTGPRHIAIALQKKVITIFGPNDPAWTQTGYKDEIQIVGKADCVPCAKKVCFQKEHLCMNSITIDMVLRAVEDLL